MRIVIIGAGEVGFHLAKTLSNEAHDVTIVDTNPEKCARAKEQLDVLVVEGSGASANTLVEAGIKNADMIIAVSALDEVNIISCMLANQFGVRRKIARVRNSEYTLNNAVLKPEQLGIDLMINPEQATAEEIVSLIERSAATDVIDFAEGKIQVIGIRLDPQAPIINKTLREVSEGIPELTFRTVAIFRHEHTIIPSGDEYFRRGDQIFVTAKTESVPEVLKLCGKSDERLEKVMILGGSKVGRTVAKLLEQEHDIDIRLIESNREKSERAAEELERTLVIHGDGTDIDLLAAEGLVDMDAFIAVTDDEETNIIACLLAKHIGVRRNIAMVSRAEYVPLMPTIGLDAAVDKRRITANAIARFIRHGEIVSVASLRGTGAEVIELVVQPHAKIVGKPLRRAKIPEGVIVGAVARGDEVFVAVGDTVLQPEDKVVVFAIPKARESLELLFG
ncbi:MAG: Trk system potassium transporter TrkA [candidate division KSB1 bacterium]|nr:Trk system potassium transporter TrkA [candidate division KSB1 bacterium]